MISKLPSFVCIFVDEPGKRDHLFSFSENFPSFNESSHDSAATPAKKHCVKAICHEQIEADVQSKS